MAHLLRCFVLCLLNECSNAFSLLNNHNFSIGNVTGGLVTNDALENSNSFRQRLNQEALIRVALVQNVHSLMKDIMTVKNSMLVLETNSEKFKLATEKTIFQLEAEIEKLKTENQRLRNDNADKHQKLIPYVNGTFQTVKDSISQMQKKFHTRLQMIEERKSNVSSTAALETSLTKVSIEIKRLQTIEALKANVSSVAALETFLTKVSSQLGNLSKRVAFTAGVSSTSSSWSSGTLVYNKVINNVGGGHNPNTGIFTAPMEGDYVFYVSILSSGINSINIDIVQNGSSKVRAGAHVAHFTDQGETGTNLVTLRLQQGDTVWVKHNSGKGYQTHSDAPFTTFSGFLI
ncbi:uncharacterized protein LOC134275302 isoform X1 [Saccostrea cucullata]|uniref:uncharacterized protein LOC134275302 isoform X1 n=1 Tax=Saccostrea cuccullata TaxID=36930 RepID=UPI002ED31D4A